MKSLNILSIATSACASIFARDAAQILSDLTNIKSQTAALGVSINNLTTTSGTDAISAIINAEQNLQDAITNGTADADATSNVTEADGAEILAYVKDLVPTIVSTLNDAINQLPVFQNTVIGDISSILFLDLAQLKNSTDEFGAALVDAAPAVDHPAATAALACIDSAFNNALNTRLSNDACTSDISIPVSTPTSTPATSTSTVAPTSTSTVAPTSTSTAALTSTPTSTPTIIQASKPGSSRPISTLSQTNSPITLKSSYSGKTTMTEPTTGSGYTTSTVYSTKTYTISSCASTITNCPYNSVTTVVIPVSTTVCPVSGESAPAPSTAYGAGTSGGSNSGESSSGESPAGPSTVVTANANTIQVGRFLGAVTAAWYIFF